MMTLFDSFKAIHDAVVAEGTTARTFPILGFRSKVPWSLIEPHRAQASANHAGYDLEKLARRGGLSPEEMIAVLEGRHFGAVRIGTAEALAKIADLLKQRGSP